jgi:hypothetical protein
MIIDLNCTLYIQQPNWRTIYTIAKGTQIPKGRKSTVYKAITEDAGNIKERYGCYAWGDDSKIYYIGSFTEDYSGDRFDSNFQGRIHNYLQNHRITETGQKNTNLMVFENINFALSKSPISLYLLAFNSLRINEAEVEFLTFTADSNLVQAIEQFLICTYRRRGQCLWNRT